MPIDEDDPMIDDEDEDDGPIGMDEDIEVEQDPDEMEVDLGPIEIPPGVPPETFNLAEEYRRTEKGRAFLKRVSDQVRDHFEADWESGKPNRERRAVIHKLFTGELDEKEYPFEDCANVHLPLMTEAITRLHARGMAELYPPDGRIWSPIATDQMDEDRRERLALHNEYQMRAEMPEFIPNQDAGLLECWLVGSVFYHSYRSGEKERNCHDYLTCEDFIMPYLWRTKDPSLGDVPRKTRILRKYRHELRAEVRRGYYDDIEALLERLPRGSAEMEEKTEVKEVVDQQEGREEEPDDDQLPYVLLEYHGWIALPDDPDNERPIVATVERDTGHLLGLFLREEVEWKDQQRYDLEKQAYDQYLLERDAYADEVDNRKVAETLVADPATPPDAMMEAQGLLAAPPRQPPAEVALPEPPRPKPIEYFTHAICIPNPVGSYGIGIGYLLCGFNITADTVTNQFLDAGTLANTVTAIVSEAAQLSSGETAITPGSTIFSPLQPEQLQQALKIIQFPPANHQLMEVASMMKEAAVGVSSAPDVYSGQPGKANETWRGIATRVEEANKNITMLMLRYLSALTALCKKNARLNFKFLKDSEIIMVVDPEKKVGVKNEIGRMDYAEDFDIQWTADVRLTSQQQRIAEADGLIQMLMGLMPALGPQGQTLLHRALVKAFRARRMPEMLEALGPEPKAPPPPKPKAPWEEDAGFLRGEDSPVHPEDDDDQHMQMHTMNMQTPEAGLLDKQGREMAERHLRFHAAQKLMKRMTRMQEEMGNGEGIPGAGPGPAPGMEGAAGNAGLPQ